MSWIGDPKISPLGLAALGLLTEGPRHPYELYQVLMQRREDVIVKIKPGTLYHVITRLEQLGFVAAVGTERDGNRPERTTYRITDEGRQSLNDQVGRRLANPEHEYPIFPVAIAQAGRLPKMLVLQHLLDRLVVIKRDTADFQQAYDTLIAAGKPPHQILDIHYLITIRDAEISWLTATIEALETGQLDWTAA